MKPEFPPEYLGDMGAVSLEVLTNADIHCGMLRLGSVCENEARIGLIYESRDGFYGMFAICDMCIEDMK